MKFVTNILSYDFITIGLIIFIAAIFLLIYFRHQTKQTIYGICGIILGIMLLIVVFALLKPHLKLKYVIAILVAVWLISLLSYEDIRNHSQFPMINRKSIKAKTFKTINNTVKSIDNDKKTKSITKHSQ